MSLKIEKLSFASDYLEGAHPLILQSLIDTNMEKTRGYGTDEYTAEACDLVRKACGTPDADVRFFIGGTQANATVIDAILRPYQGVLCADTAHINGHEAGAIEHGGHKVMTLPHHDGRITADQIAAAAEQYLADENREHIVMPGMVYITHPTEYGTLYTLDELTRISEVCRRYRMPLYLDGARLAYALACGENEITLPDLGRLCDVFYIGGSKCGCLFGEAVVVPDPTLIPHFFPIIKQHGAHLEKGRLLGLQFRTMFADGLYCRIGETAVEYADRIKRAFLDRGYRIHIDAPTNQVFPVLTKAQQERLFRDVEFGFWENLDDGSSVWRVATSWATRGEDVDRLIGLL
jgi:threonine aldolase